MLKDHDEGALNDCMDEINTQLLVVRPFLNTRMTFNANKVEFTRSSHRKLRC